MIKLLAVCFIACCVEVPVQAAFLQCFVIDADTGRPLARSAITIEGVQGGQAPSRNSLRTDHAGSAMFGPMADGPYIVTVSRAAFATQQYGQSGWNRPGVPLMVQGDQPVGIQIRLRRLPSITGAVWDENQIGIPGAQVIVYTATRPAKLVAKGLTDDRGIYRVGELVPGTYVVRNAARQFEDGLSIVPTFYPDGNAITQARMVEIDLDHSAQDINFSPAQGRLFRVAGRVAGSSRGGASAVELISDTGRVSAGVDGRGAFSFEGVAPGTYELFAQADRESGWIRQLVDRDQEGVRVEMVPVAPARLIVADKDGNRLDPKNVSLFARRKDLDADGPVIPVVPGRTVLAPGNWELAVSTATNFYPVSVSPFMQPVNLSVYNRADGWNPFTVATNPAVSVVVSTHPATLHGRVLFSANNPAPQVPVFLETLDIDANEPPQVRTTRTDQSGIYDFAGLPPGRYRVVSTYDADPTSRASIDAAGPQYVTLRESSNESQDLQIQIR